MGFFHLFGLLCLLAATVLLVFVSVGLPVWDKIYFLQVNLSSVANEGGNGILRMGQWGLCISGDCTKSKLGYDLSLVQSHISGNDEVVTADIIHGLTYALVLNPIAAGFSFLALLFAISSHLILGILGSIFAFFSFLVTIVALGIDLGLFVTTRHRLDNIVNDNAVGSTNYSSMYGPALWLVVAAAILQLLAAFTVCFTHHSERKRRNRDVATGAAPVGTQRRGLFGRRNNNVAADPYAGNNNVVTEPYVGNEKPMGRRWFWQKNRGAQAY